MENLKEKLMILQQESAISEQTIVESLKRIDYLDRVCLDNTSLRKCFDISPFLNVSIEELADKQQADRYQILDSLADVYGSCIQVLTRYGFSIEELKKVVSLKLVERLMKTDPNYSSYLESLPVDTDARRQWEYYQGVIEEIPSKVDGYIIKPDKNSSFFHYLLLQRVTDGWSYTILNERMEEVEDGIYDNPDVGKGEMIANLMLEFAPSPNCSGSLILFWERLPDSVVEKMCGKMTKVAHSKQSGK